MKSFKRFFECAPYGGYPFSRQLISLLFTQNIPSTFHSRVGNTIIMVNWWLWKAHPEVLHKAPAPARL